MPPDVAFFVALESRVWQALSNGDGEADRSLLDPQFVGVYSSGYASREDHVAQLRKGPSVATFSINEPRLLILAADTALLAYRASFTRLGGTSPNDAQTMYVSSVWKQRDGAWLNVFSQDTVASDVG